MKNISDKIEKIVINIGVGKMRNTQHFDEKILPEIEKDISAITGQKPSRRSSKKSIAGFKVRQGDVVGLQVTLRKSRMEDFFERLTKIAMPRVKDFRGLDEKIIDGNGHLNIGLKDQHVFPEIDPNTSKVTFGLQITLVNKARKMKEAVDFYKKLGIPLKK